MLPLRGAGRLTLILILDGSNSRPCQECHLRAAVVEDAKDDPGTHELSTFFAAVAVTLAKAAVAAAGAAAASAAAAGAAAQQIKTNRNDKFCEQTC